MRVREHRTPRPLASPDRRTLPEKVDVTLLVWSPRRLVAAAGTGSGWDSFALQRQLVETAYNKAALPPLFPRGAFSSVSRARRRWLRAAAKIIALNSVRRTRVRAQSADRACPPQMCLELDSEPDQVVAGALRDLRAAFSVFQPPDSVRGEAKTCDRECVIARRNRQHRRSAAGAH